MSPPLNKAYSDLQTRAIVSYSADYGTAAPKADNDDIVVRVFEQTVIAELAERTR